MNTFVKPRRSPGNFSTPRQRALAAWRGVDLAPLELARTHSAKSVGLLMPTLLKELGLERRRAEAELVKVWNHLIDPNLVAHAQPTGLHKGTLFVTVDNSVWLSEIVRYRRHEILERIQLVVGKAMVQKISFRVG